MADYTPTTGYIKTEKTARYSIIGRISEKTKYFWFALHGSHMLAEQMTHKFTDFDLDEHFIIAPEGLNRFYKNGFGGETVASWMTSRDRLHEIEDFSYYLSRLYKKYTDQLPIDCKRVVLGFSQGATTAFRWLHHTPESIDALIDYAGWIPEDIDLAASNTSLGKLQLIFTYGLQDQFLTKERLDKLDEIIASNDLKVNIIPHEGTHRVDRKQLKLIADLLK